MESAGNKSKIQTSNDKVEIPFNRDKLKIWIGKRMVYYDG